MNFNEFYGNEPGSIVDYERLLQIFWYHGVQEPKEIFRPTKPSGRPGLELDKRYHTEFAAKRAPIREDDDVSLHTTLEDYNPAVTTPVFYGRMYERVTVDEDLIASFDPAVSHPACLGYVFVDHPPPSPPASPPPPPPKDKCSPTEYLDYYIFPVLLPALEEMLHQAKKEKCFERKRTKFNALDFITEFLYRNNPGAEGRDGVTFEEIPFVKEWWKDHPRTPLPKSLLWTEEEASLIIQAFYRGYKVRLHPEIQELRQWQRDWREDNKDVNNKVDEFWSKQMPENPDEDPESTQEPDNTPPTPNTSPSHLPDV